MHTTEDYSTTYNNIHKYLINARKEMVLLMGYGELTEEQLKATEGLMNEFNKLAKKVIAAGEIQSKTDDNGKESTNIC